MHKPCQSCGKKQLTSVIDLGSQPLANNLLRSEDLNKVEPFFPLEVLVCQECWLMQIAEIIPPTTMFSEYIYFSSFSDQMLRHARTAAMRWIEEKQLGARSFVAEIASNDGYMLQNFVQAKIPCVGIEPAENVAKVARAKGVETRCEFFGLESARRLKQERGCCDLILGNNVFAHAPDTNDFVAGLRELIKPEGWIVLEFPYGVEMIEKTEFDTIYHEHVFYFTLLPLLDLFARHDMAIFHVEKLEIHGGSLRIFAAKKGAEVIRSSVGACVTEEHNKGVNSMRYYATFREKAEAIKADLIDFMREKKAAKQSIAAYGASAKGSTLLNFIGKEASEIIFIADRSTYKQGKLSPGLHIPIVSDKELSLRQPDFALMLVWNFSKEVMEQQSEYSRAGGKFVIPLPTLKVI